MKFWLFNRGSFGLNLRGVFFDLYDGVGIVFGFRSFFDELGAGLEFVMAVNAMFRPG